MKRIISIATAGTLALVMGFATPDAHAECSASLQKNVKYHWVAFGKDGKVQKTGWIKFTDKTSKTGLNLAWLKTDGTTKKESMWGRHGKASLRLATWGKGTWWAYEKFCKGEVIWGAVRQGGQRSHFFTIHTDRKR